MKNLSLFVSLVFACAVSRLPAQPTQTATLGSTYQVWSSHSTTSDGIQSWSAVSLASPSGRWYTEDTYGDAGRPDGSASVAVTLNEAGIWQVWYLSGHDAPQSGSSSSSIILLLDVQPAAPPKRAPSIAWSSAPVSAADGQGYTISAHGHDDDGNLAQVNVWKNGQPFAFAGGGNGYDGDSGNTTSDAGPQSVTFTAQAVDSAGASSPTISWTVTISAPPPVNHAPVISWNTAPGTVADGQSYAISAHGHDDDGNLTQVNVWKNGQPFAFAGGGNGTDGDSANSTSDAGPTTVTFTAQAVDSDGATSATISQTVTVSAPPPVNHPPVISWNTSPATWADGQSYTISAHGHDEDGNLTQVNVWKNGQPFAFSGGGNGTDGDSGNATSDAGPTTVTFTAQAVDSNGATSATISQTVTISAPPPVNHPPTISWNTTPGTVASSQSYTVSAHGYDPDRNLTQVNVWKNGTPFAFAGGGNGTDGDSGNATSDTGPTTVTFTAQAVDSNGATSATISQTVTVSAPPPVNHAPIISWNTAPGTVANGQSYTISAHGHDQDDNLNQVNVWRNGSPFAFAGGGNGTDNDSGNSTSDAGPQSITFTAQAVDSDGATSATISQTVTISAPPPVNHPPTITWNTPPGAVANGQSYTISAHGHDQDGNLTQVNVWKDGVPFAFTGGGNGTDNDSDNPASDGGPATITFTAQAVDADGATSPTISQTVTIGAPPPVNHPPTISWNPTPGIVASGQNYAVSARGHDQDGNLTQVNVWKNGVPFAFAGGGNGTDSDSANATNDPGPAMITFTAQAVDADGATSATISQTVMVSAPPPINHPPTISWNTTPGTIASGQNYSVSAHGHDQDGNLTQVNVWKNAVPFAFAGGGNGTDSDSANATNDPGPATITFTARAVDSDGATSATISQTVIIGAPPTLNRPPMISWITTPGTVASGQSYTVSAHGHDPDGNLTQVNIWKNGAPFAFAGGGNGTDGDAANSSTDAGLPFITYTAQAVDADGATSAMISQTVTLSAPPPVQFTLNTGAGAGGNVSPGGTYNAGTVMSVTATPDAMHDFAGWSGDAPGNANPVSVILDRNKSVQANFSLKLFALTTSAVGGGSVTAGGAYPYGTVVTLSAAPDAMSRFVGWMGDATGGVPSVAITMTATRTVQALFTGKMAQTISFPAPGDRSINSTAFPPGATATSGLPVSYTVLSGPATISGGQLQLTGPGAVTIQASQPGDATYLPAPAVARTFNAVAPAVLKYRAAARTLLQREAADGPTSLVLEKP